MAHFCNRGVELAKMGHVGSDYSVACQFTFFYNLPAIPIRRSCGIGSLYLFDYIVIYYLAVQRSYLRHFHSPGIACYAQARQ